MKYITSVFLLFLLCFINPDFSYCQAIQLSKYYNLFDSFTDIKNKGVFNGAEYVDEYPEFPLRAEVNNKFYDSYNFRKGDIIYDGQPYYDLRMKYDLLNDLVILEFVNNKVNFISLSPEFIDEFKILGDKFVRVENNAVLSPYYRNGFFKETFAGDSFLLFTKYEKEGIQYIEEKKVYYKFRERQVYFMVYKNVFHRIDSKRDVLKVLSNFEEPVKRFFKKSPQLFRKNKELFLANLLKHLEETDTESKKIK